MNEENIGRGLIVVMPLLIGAMLMIAPLTRRRFLMFSVRVRPEWSDGEVARGIIRHYRLQVGFLSVVAVALGYGGLSAGSNWLFVSGPLLLGLGGVVALLWGRRATLPYANHDTNVRSASLENVKLPGVSPIHAAVPFLILAAAAYWLREHWDAIPARFPIHWDLAGKPNGWSQRTEAGVYTPLVIGALICLLMIGTGLGLTYGAARLGGGTKTVRWQVLRMFRWMGYLMSLLFAYISLGPLYPQYTRAAWLAPVVVAATAILVIPVIRASSDPDGSEAERTPDEAWKFGLFYYNPDDPALMVEKRMGIGYTLNFGHPLAWVLTAAALAVPVVAVVAKS